MQPEVNFTLLWREEQAELDRLAGLVPNGGTIVEIGTALGGTATIFNRATKEKNVSIYTVDISPSARAYKNLEGTGVNIIASASEIAAESWAENIGKPIDLLFIDGNHHFEYVFQDYELWRRYVKPGGTIVFHDYDPDERGGIVHFGVQVFLDAMVADNVLDNSVHSYKLLYGTVPETGSISVSLTSCYNAFMKIMRDAAEVCNKVYANPIEQAMDILKNRTIPMTSTQACYCIQHGLEKHFDYMELICNSSNEFRRWVEALTVLDHAYGSTGFPDCFDASDAPIGVKELSAIVAKEQIRLTILACITRTLVNWSL